MFPKSFTYLINLALAALIIASCGGEQVAYQPTPTRVIPTPTSTPIPTLTPQPTATLVPTREPSEEFWQNLQEYPPTAFQKIIDGNVYSVYVAKFNGTHVHCKVYVDRWDGYTHKTIFSKEGVYCDAVNWDTFSNDDKDIAARKDLKMSGYWSDINNNGKFEFTIRYDLGGGGFYLDLVNNTGLVIYEIRDNTVVEVIGYHEPNYKLIERPQSILRSTSPLTIYLHTYTRLKVYKNSSTFAFVYLDLPAIYQWDGEKYLNVSKQYPDDFRSHAKRIVEGAKQPKDKYYYYLPDLLSILDLYEEANLPQKEALDLFLEASNLSNWLDSDSRTLCLLQVMRGSVQMNYEKHQPFDISYLRGLFSDYNPAPC